MRRSCSSRYHRPLKQIKPNRGAFNRMKILLVILPFEADDSRRRCLYIEYNCCSLYLCAPCRNVSNNETRGRRETEAFSVYTKPADLCKLTDQDTLASHSTSATRRPNNVPPERGRIKEIVDETCTVCKN